MTFWSPTGPLLVNRTGGDHIIHLVAFAKSIGSTSTVDASAALGRWALSVTRDNANEDLALYRQMRHHASFTAADAARTLGVSCDAIGPMVARLGRLGLLTRSERDPSAIVPIGPGVAAVKMLTRGRDELTDYKERLSDLHDALATIIDEFLTLGSSDSSDVRVNVMSDLRQVAAYLDTATDLSREEVLTMHPTAPPAEHLMNEGSERNQRHIARGLRLRTIYQRNVMSLPHMTTHLRELTGLGAHVRLADVVPIRLLVFDRTRAVLPIDPADGLAGAIAIEGEAFVTSLARIFDFCWQHSSSVSDLRAESAGLPLSGRQHAVLRMLAAGMKDEKIARDLGVSLRTVTRIIGEVMHRLEADNRFQAGARAAELGWLE